MSRHKTARSRRQKARNKAANDRRKKRKARMMQVQKP